MQIGTEEKISADEDAAGWGHYVIACTADMVWFLCFIAINGL